MTPAPAIVIGGGVAGSAAAIQLARQGQPVILIEKETTAHHKVCGEFISAEAVPYLRDLGVDPAAFKAPTLNRLRLINQAESAEIALPFEATSLSRQVLDEALLQQAVVAGVDVRRGVSVQSLVPAAGGWQVAINDGSNLIAPKVLLACGKHDLRGHGRVKAGADDYIGFKMYFRLSAQQQAALAHTIELYLFERGYAGFEPVEDGRANLCLVVRKARFAACGKSWPALLATLRQELPLLDQRLTDATPCWDKPLAIFGIPYGFVFQPPANEPDGLYRLGDQMGVIPSLCGDGIAIALHTARLAATCTSSADYYRQARQHLCGPIRRAMWGSRVLSSGPLQTIVTPCLRAMPSLAQSFIRSTRMPSVQRNASISTSSSARQISACR